MVSTTTRITCTIAMARRSAPYSAASTMTCASAPGLAPNSADLRSPSRGRSADTTWSPRSCRRSTTEQHRDAERKRGEPLQRLRRHHRAERNADQHGDDARSGRGTIERPADQRRCRHRQQRPGDQTGGKAEQREDRRRPPPRSASVSAVRNRTCGEVADDDGIGSDQCRRHSATSNGAASKIAERCPPFSRRFSARRRFQCLASARFAPGRRHFAPSLSMIRAR